jgi:hypothetical protein
MGHLRERAGKAEWIKSNSHQFDKPTSDPNTPIVAAGDDFCSTTFAYPSKQMLGGRKTPYDSAFFYRYLSGNRLPGRGNGQNPPFAGVANFVIPGRERRH